MVNVIIIFILLAIIVPGICYIVRAKKKGQGCIGCPSGAKCSGNCHGNSMKDFEKAHK